jgi:hypothetical protein
LDPAAVTTINALNLRLFESVQRKINAIFPPDFSDLKICVQDVTFKVHSVVIKQKQGLLQILSRDWAWNKKINVIELKSYKSIDIAAVLLILYGFNDTRLFNKIESFTTSNIYEIWDSLYPGTLPHEVGVQGVFKMQDCVGADFAFYFNSDDTQSFGHQAYLGAKSSKLYEIFKAYLPKKRFVIIPIDNLNREQMRTILEYLYEEKYTLLVNPKNLPGLFEHAHEYLDDPHDFFVKTFHKILQDLMLQDNDSLLELMEIIKKQNYIPIQPAITKITKFLLNIQYNGKSLTVSQQKRLNHLDLRKVLNTEHEVNKTISFLRLHPHIRSVDLRGTVIENEQLNTLAYELKVENVIVDES